MIGGWEVMRGQLATLLDIAEWLNVEITLRRSAHAGLDGLFWLFEMSSA